jgi:Tol biopolymer transport system component
MNKQRAFFVILLLGICACNSRQAPSLPTPESTSASVTILTTTPTEMPTSIKTPTLKPTELLSHTPSLTESPTPITLLQLSGPYLGQEPPGMEPEIFAPGIISSPDFSEYSGAFSPDSTEYYFFRYSPTSESVLLFSKVVDGRWSVPEQLAITSEYEAFEPYVTLDNQRLYFAWGYPVSAGQPQFPYFFVDRTENGWSEPKFAGQGMFLSSSQDGQLYTTDMSSRNVDGKTYLAQITVTDGVFTDYERLPIETSWGNPAHPCIAPDGSYILFDVGSGNYLFVSFRKADGAWGEPIDLTNHGFDSMAGGAYISPDGKYLFFSLNKDIWWVDINVIENLRPLE